MRQRQAWSTRAGALEIYWPRTVDLVRGTGNKPTTKHVVNFA